jgi:2',3'-cyclic-nucleotide 2'-phosphodiesterase (5'-nucleotidase family)
VENLFTTKWLLLMGTYLTPLAKNEVVMTRNYTSENDLGNLITNLMKAAVPEGDIVILNAGGFRTTWVPGVIQYQHFYNMFPFNNTINSVKMTGHELLNTLTIIQSGTKAFYPTYGLSQFVNISSTGVKKFINATLYNGSAIVPTQNYRIVSIQFLTQGGDDFKNVINKNYTVRN